MSDTQYNITAWKAQMDSTFADNTQGDVEVADHRQALRDAAETFAIKSSPNIFSEDNVGNEIDHVFVFGATGVDAYGNTNEVKPTTHIYCDDTYALAIENVDNVDADTKRWVLGQEDDGDLALMRISESGGTDTPNTIFTVDQADVFAFTGGFKSNSPSGTFTPVLQFGGSSTGITYSIQEGKWYRNGNALHIQIVLGLTNKGSATGAATITGLPYNGENVHSGTGIENGFTPYIISAANTDFYGYINGGTSTISFLDINTFNTSTETDWNNTTRVQMSFTYFTTDTF